jgi:hypothetical protein
MPAGCIFGHKGPAIFVEGDDEPTLLALLAVTNSAAFRYLVELQMAFGSYEVGVIQRTPVPAAPGDELPALARRAHDLQRENYTHDETTHVFGIPVLAARRAEPTLAAAAKAHLMAAAERRARLAAVQDEIDRLVGDLYGVASDELRVTSDEGVGGGEADAADDEDSEDEFQFTLLELASQDAAIIDPKPEIEALLMWCVGVAFGRWDIDYALDPSLLPPLPGPFDPLPRQAPGAVTNDELRVTSDADASELVTRRSSLVTCLVDDPGHPADIVAQVRAVLDRLYGPRAEAIEREACAALGVNDLRDYFRDPRRFFAHHLKRYSKSRRKAPLYWPLQSARRAYTVWLYYPRIGPTTYLEVAREVVDGKVRREELALADLRAGLAGAAGAALRRRVEEAERQAALVDELVAFRKVLDRVGIARLHPDPNDGVLIGIAPLHELVPWKEAAVMYKALRSGQYGWSAMAKKLNH